MDIALVAASVFVLVCLMQPTEEIWIARLQRSDGSIASFRVEQPFDDENESRRAVLDDLVQPETGKRGMVRWQNETSLFYASADAARLASTAKASPFQTASFDAARNVVTNVEPESRQWVTFWQQRAERSGVWLQQRQDVHEKRLARLSESLEIARTDHLLPAREGIVNAFVAACLAITIGVMWCWCFPRRTFARGTGTLQTSFSPENESKSASFCDDVKNHSEPAAMSFRAEWVRLKQPFAVHARRATGWGVVLAAIIGLAGRFV